MRILLSRRRTDSPRTSARVVERLAAAYGRDNLFDGVDRAGVESRRVVREWVGRCDVVLVLIGPGWLDRPPGTCRRIDDPGDLVRLSIHDALKDGVPILPLLVDGAILPAGSDLPEILWDLTRREAVAVRPDPDFHRDVDRVIEVVGGPANLAPWPERAEEGTKRASMIRSGRRLRIVGGPMGGRVFPLDRERMLVGRSAECDVWLADDPASSRFALDLAWDGSTRSFRVSSRNRGVVTLNNCIHVKEPIELAPGDCIRIGLTVILYEAADSDAEP